jgi:hypothetical protein
MKQSKTVLQEHVLTRAARGRSSLNIQRLTLK